MPGCNGFYPPQLRLMMLVIGGREVGQVGFCKLAKKQGFSSSGDSFPTTALDLAAGADPALIELPFVAALAKLT